MKRLLIALFLCLFAFKASAWNPMIVTSGGGATGEAGCIAGTTFSWNSEHSVDTDTACDSAGSPLAGTLVDATIVDDYVLVTAVNDYLQWTIDSTEFNGSLGTVWLSFYLIDGDTDTDVEAGTIFEIYGDVANEIFCYVATATDTVACTHRGTATNLSVGGGNETLVHNTWYRLGYAWNVSTGAQSVTAEVLGQAAAWDDDADAIDNMAVQPTLVTIGEQNSANAMADHVRTKDFVICNTYKCTDPL